MTINMIIIISLSKQFKKYFDILHICKSWDNANMLKILSRFIQYTIIIFQFHVLFLYLLQFYATIFRNY